MCLLAVGRVFSAFLIMALLAAVVSAEMPAHLVLVRPQASAVYSPYSPAVRLPAQPYPYGYFGAHGTTHWQRQFGIHRNFTQWSQK